jgi:sRNA-binding regulator protein Hfq
MSISPTLPLISDPNRALPELGTGRRSGMSAARARKGLGGLGSPLTHYTPADFAADGSANRQAELFYLQKQIHTQTPMVIVLEDGERLEGCIEWYDRNSLKVRGRMKGLIYKSAIKYMFKVGEGG